MRPNASFPYLHNQQFHFCTITCSKLPPASKRAEHKSTWLLKTTGIWQRIDWWRVSGVSEKLATSTSKVLFSDHLENVDNKLFRNIGSPFANRQCVFCKSSLFPSNAAKTSNRAEIHTFVALVFYLYPTSFLRRRFNFLRPAFALIINTSIINLMFFWPCIMNWLYINYQLDALIIIYS